MYSLVVLGGVRLDGPSGPVTGHLAQRRQLALLVLLATTGPAGRSRDKLQGLLWPESSADAAGHSLADAVYRVRKALGDDCIQGTRDTLRLNPAVVRADVAVFQAHLERGELEEAVALYRGTFLDGFHLRGSIEFEDWQSAESRRLAQQFEGALETLAEKAEAAGDFLRAVGHWSRLSAHDPLNTRFAMRHMAALGAAGDPGNAIQAGERHTRLLREELGAEGPSGLAALLESLKAGDRKAREGPASADARGSADVPPPDAMVAAEPGPKLRASATFPALPTGSKRAWGSARVTVYVGATLLGFAAAAVLLSRRSGEHEGAPNLSSDARPGIAVLPCENLSPDPEDAFYAEGLHDAVITRLQSVSGIVPTSRSSVVGYRENPASPSQIARELNVSYLGECSVLKAENRVQVRFRLIEAIPGIQIWADQFDAVLGGAANIIDLQNEIARKVVEGVGARLTPDEQSRITARPTGDLDAYELYMIGRNRLAQYSRETLREAIGYFEAAIRADSAFALAYSGLGEAMVLLPLYDLTARPPEVRERARAAVTRAYVLDPTAGEVHSSMGLFLHLFEWDWAAAERHYREGLRLKPGDALARVYFASLLSGLGRFEEGVEETRLVLAMDPRSSGVMWASGNRMWQAGRVEEARTLYETATRMEPTVPWVFSHLAFSYARDEPLDLARSAELLSEFVRRFGYHSPDRVSVVVDALGGGSGARAQAMETLEDVVAATILERPHMIFEYAALAPEDVLFELLDEAVRTRHVWVPWIPISVMAARSEIMDDPRWEEFLARIGHPGFAGSGATGQAALPADARRPGTGTGVLPDRDAPPSPSPSLATLPPPAASNP